MNVTSSGAILVWTPLTITGSLASQGHLLVESQLLTSVVVLDVSGDLTNSGTLGLSELLGGGGEQRQAETRIDVGGVITNQTGATIYTSSTYGETTDNPPSLSGELINDGSLNVGYPFRLRGSGRTHVNNGTFVIADDTKISLSTGSTFTNNGSIELSESPLWIGDGVVNLETGSITGTGEVTLERTTVTGDTFAVSSGWPLELIDSTVDASLINRGSVTVLGATIVTVPLDNDGGVLRVGDDSNGGQLSTVGFANKGLFEMGTSISEDAWLDLISGVLDNTSSGVIRGVGTGDGGRTIVGPVSNAGMIEALEADLAIDLTTGGRAPASFTNLGTVDIGSGRTLSVSGALARDASSLTQSGTIEVATGGTLTFDTAVFAATAGSTTTVDGTFELIGVNGEFENGAVVEATAGSWLAVRGGGSGGATVSFADGVTLDGGLELGNDDPGAGARDVTVTVGGAGLVQNEGGLIQSVHGTGGGARTIIGEVVAAAVMRVEHPLLITGSDLAHSVSGTVEITGGDLTIDLTGARAPSSFTNLGTIEIGSGRSLLTLGSVGRAPSSFTNLGTIDLASNSTLSVSAGELTNAIGGVIGGVGTVVVSDASFTNDGTIRPGQSAGTLHVAGSISNSPSSVLEIEVGRWPWDAHDVLSVSGTVTVDGVLRARLLTDEPEMGLVYSVATAGGLSGTFRSVDQPTTLTGRGFAVTVADDVELEVVCATGPQLVMNSWVDPVPVTEDHELRLVAEVSSEGGATAAAPEVTVSLPAALSFEGSDPQDACWSSWPDVICELAPVPPGGRSQVTILTRPWYAAETSVSVSVATTSTCEVDLSDNFSETTVEIVDAEPCDANDDGEITAADVPVAAACAFGHSAAGNPNCSETGGTDAEDLILIIEQATQ